MPEKKKEVFHHCGVCFTPLTLGEEQVPCKTCGEVSPRKKEIGGEPGIAEIILGALIIAAFIYGWALLALGELK